jgi:ankyrin repeat protein
MGRADALEAMIRGGEVHRDAVDASSDFAFTLLMAAAMSGARGACKRLVSLGADASATDARGRTALDLALEYGHDAVADLLARKGAPFGDPAKDGKDGAAEARDANASAEPSAPPAPAGGFPSAATPPAGGTVAALVPASETSPGSDGGIPTRDEGPLLSPE